MKDIELESEREGEREREGGIPASPKRARAGLRLSGSISSIKRSEREGEEKRELPEEAESRGQEGPVLFLRQKCAARSGSRARLCGSCNGGQEPL